MVNRDGPHSNPASKRRHGLLFGPFGLMLVVCFDPTELHGDSRNFDQAHPTATLAQLESGRVGVLEFW
jgi:hypothetical protein